MSDVTCSVRPESMSIVKDANSENSVDATFTHSVYLGHLAEHVFQLADNTPMSLIQLQSNSNPTTMSKGQYQLGFASDDVVVLAD